MARSWTLIALGLFITARQCAEVACGCAQVSPECYVMTKNGPVQGVKNTTIGGREYCAYMGVPFAQPPIGPLRFKPPISLPGRKYVYYANETKPACPQIQSYSTLANYSKVVGNEDCLYLNIFTPLVGKQRNLKKLYPVLFFIHGGHSYSTGYGADQAFVSPYLLLDQDFVLVVTNYRLGALGFLSTGDCILSGNWGLKDIAFALYQFQANADRFGADVSSINAIGDGHGSNLAELLFFVPQSRVLLNKCILGSGNIQAIYAIAPQPYVTTPTKNLAKLLGCPTNSSELMRDCLREVPFEKIVQQQDNVFPTLDLKELQGTVWAPVIESPETQDAALTYDPTQPNCCGIEFEILRGVGAYDGGFYTSNVLDPKTGLMKRFNKDRITTLINVLQLGVIFCEECIRQVATEMDQYFFKGRRITHASELELDNLFSTWYYYLGAHFDTQQRTVNKQYFNLYNVTLTVTFNSIFGGNLTETPTRDDILLSYLPVNALFPHRTYPAADRNITDQVTRAFYNFIVYGKPARKTGIEWKPVVQDGKIPYLQINNNGSVFLPNFYPDSVEFIYYLTRKYPYKANPLVDYNKC